MKPFMHKLCSYFNFLSSVDNYFSIKKGITKEESEYVFKFKELMNKLERYAYPCIMSGRDYPVSKFTAEELEKICEDINNVWYCLDDKWNYIIDYLICCQKVSSFDTMCIEYLNEIFPHKYEKQEISLDLICAVSGKFYTEEYLPIKNIPYEYETWCNLEKTFQKISFYTIVSCLVTLVFVLMLRSLIPFVVINVLAMLSIIALVFSLYEFVRLERLARKLFR